MNRSTGARWKEKGGSILDLIDVTYSPSVKTEDDDIREQIGPRSSKRLTAKSDT